MLICHQGCIWGRIAWDSPSPHPPIKEQWKAVLDTAKMWGKGTLIGCDALCRESLTALYIPYCQLFTLIIPFRYIGLYRIKYHQHNWYVLLLLLLLLLLWTYFKATCFDQRLLSSGHENRKRYSIQSHFLVFITESSKRHIQ